MAQRDVGQPVGPDHHPSPPHGQAKAAELPRVRLSPPFLPNYSYIYLHLCIYNDFSSCFPVCKSFHYRALQEKFCTELHKRCCCTFHPRAPSAEEGCQLSPKPLLLPEISIPTARGVCWVLRAWGAVGPPLRMLPGARCPVPGPSPCRWG